MITCLLIVLRRKGRNENRREIISLDPVSKISVQALENQVLSL